MDPTIKQENVEYQLLSPISSSSPMTTTTTRTSKFNVVKVTPTTRRFDITSGGVSSGIGTRSETTSDHEYFSTPNMGTPSSSSGSQHRVYLTPSSGAGRGGATGIASLTPTSGTLLVPAQKVLT